MRAIYLMLNFLHIRKEEAKNFWISLALLIFMWMGSFFSQPILQSLIVPRLGIEIIPYTYIFGIFISFISILVFLRISHRFTSNSILFFTLIFNVCFLIIARILLEISDIDQKSRWELYLFTFLIVAANSTALASGVWNLINNLFNLGQLKRLLPMFLLAPLIAGIVAGVAIRYTVLSYGPKELLSVWSTFIVVSIIILYFVYIKSLVSLFAESHKKIKKNIISIIKQEFSYLIHHEIASVIILYRFFNASMGCLIQFQIIYTVNHYYSNPDSLSLFWSNYFIVIYSSIFLFQLLFRNRLSTYLGVMNSLLLNPFLYVIGFVILLFNFGIWEAVTIRGFAFLILYMFQIAAIQIGFSIIPPQHRPNIRIISETLTFIAVGMVGIFLILLKNNIIYVDLLGITLSLVWFLLTWTGKKLYFKELLVNISDKHMRFEALELIDTHNPQISEKMFSILESNEYETNDKLYVLQAIGRLEDTTFIRQIISMLENQNFEIRIEAIETLITLKNCLGGNFLIDSHMQDAMLQLLCTDPNEIVRAKAAKYLLYSLPREKFFSIFAEILKEHHDPQTRLVTFQSLGHLPFEYIDLLQKKGLQDENPLIQSEAIVALWKYREYKKICIESLKKLLKQDNNKSANYSGLKAVLRMNGTENIPDEILKCTEPYLYHANNLLKITATLIFLKYCKPDEDEAWLKQLLDLLISARELNEKNWKEFNDLLLAIKKENVLDEILDKLILLIPDYPHLAAGMQHFADSMYRKEIYESETDII